MIKYPEISLPEIQDKFKDKDGNALSGKLESLNHHQCKCMVFVELNGRKNVLLNSEDVFKTDKIDKVILFPLRGEEERQQVKIIIKNSNENIVFDTTCSLLYDFEYYKYKIIYDLSSASCYEKLAWARNIYFNIRLCESFGIKNQLESKGLHTIDLLMRSYKIGDVEKDFNVDRFASVFDEVINTCNEKRDVAFIFEKIERLNIDFENFESMITVYSDLFTFLCDNSSYISKSVGDFKKGCRELTGLDICLFDDVYQLEDDIILQAGKRYKVEFINNDGRHCNYPFCLVRIGFGVDGDVDGNVKVSENIISLIKSDCFNDNGDYVIPYGTKYSGLKKLLEERNPFLKTMTYRLIVNDVNLPNKEEDLFIADGDKITIVFAADQSDVIVPNGQKYGEFKLFLGNNNRSFNLSVPVGISYNDFVSLLKRNLVMKFGAARCAGFDFNNLNLFIGNNCITYSEDPNDQGFVADDYYELFLYDDPNLKPNFNPNKDDKKDVNGGCCFSGCCCCKSVGGKKLK